LQTAQSQNSNKKKDGVETELIEKFTQHIFFEYNYNTSNLNFPLAMLSDPHKREKTHFF
jgi:hypothetical protein